MILKTCIETFQIIRKESHDEVFKRQRLLALELPLTKEFTLLQVPDLSIRLAKMYSNSSEKTLIRDINRLVELELIRKTDGEKYIANTDILIKMIAKRKNIRTEGSV